MRNAFTEKMKSRYCIYSGLWIKDLKMASLVS